MKNSLIKIAGNTYPVKDQLKALGARWNGDDKCWMISADKADEARAIVAGSKAPARRNFGAPISYRRLSDPRVQARMEAAWLQRGRGFLAAEIRRNVARAAQSQRASTGPRLFGRGDGTFRRALLVNGLRISLRVGGRMSIPDAGPNPGNLCNSLICKARAVSVIFPSPCRSHLGAGGVGSWKISKNEDFGPVIPPGRGVGDSGDEAGRIDFDVGLAQGGNGSLAALRCRPQVDKYDLVY